jgi:hypothetical protein
LGDSIAKKAIALIDIAVVLEVIIHPVTTTQQEIVNIQIPENDCVVITSRS